MKSFPHWRDGRVVDYNGLENRRTERYRGFESLSLRFSQRVKPLSCCNLGAFCLVIILFCPTFCPTFCPGFCPTFFSEEFFCMKYFLFGVKFFHNLHTIDYQCFAVLLKGWNRTFVSNHIIFAVFTSKIEMLKPLFSVFF